MMLRKILLRFFALLLVVFFLNLIYKEYFWAGDLQKVSVYDSLQRVYHCSEILYFGESSNFSYSPFDTDQRSISELMGLYFPGLKTGTVNKGALHAGVYSDLLPSIPEDSRTRAIVVTMNLRSFGADWIHSGLETLLSQERVMLKDRPPLWNRFMLGLKAYDNKPEGERRKMVKKAWKNEYLAFPYTFPVSHTLEWVEGILTEKYPIRHKDSAERALAANYVRNFAFQIDTLQNPRIRDFDRIVAYAGTRGWKVVFNLLSENMEQIRSIVGEDLVFLMKRNRDILVDRYTRMGAIVCDNLETVGADEFFDKSWPTEHYSETGRKKVAGNLALSLRPIFAEYFQDMGETRLFTNDFEGYAPGFGKTQVFKGISRSGTHSNPLDSVQEYSTAFSIPLKKLQQASITHLDVKGWLLGLQNPFDIKLVFSVEKDGQPLQWDGLHVVKDPLAHEWTQTEYLYKVPEGMETEGTLMKVYFWYTGTGTVYLDDFRIELKSISP